MLSASVVIITGAATLEGWGMCRLLLAIAVAVSLLLPFCASAQQAPPAQSQPAPEGGTPGKLLAIGIGIVAGVAVAEAIGVVDTASLLGGVVGGYLAAWWYDSWSDGGRIPASVRQPTAASAVWRSEQLALAH
jgi:hypothetical protein